MARAVAAGDRVVCVTATRGELGSPDEERWPSGAPLAAVRTAEMQRALAILGVTEHHWLDYPDGGCADVDQDEAVRRVTALMAEVQPDTVLTFGPDGMTGHDDHKAVCRWATAAFEAVAPDGSALGYATNSPEWLAEFREPLDKFNVFMGAEPPCTPRDEQLFSLAARGRAARDQAGGDQVDDQPGRAPDRRPRRGLLPPRPGRGVVPPALTRARRAPAGSCPTPDLLSSAWPRLRPASAPSFRCARVRLDHRPSGSAGAASARPGARSSDASAPAVRTTRAGPVTHRRPGRSARSTSRPPGRSADRRRRARPGARRRPRARRRRAAGRRARRRASRPCCSTSPPRFAERGRALYVTGEESAAQVRLRADRIGALRDDLFLAAETDLAAVLGHVDAVQARPAGRRLGADRRQRRGRRRARRRHPGPRGRGRPDPGRQGARHRDRPGRPRHQGRLDRRAAAARAPRRRRAALRGRPALPAAHGARRQEPLRPGRRGRLLRPVRRRHRRAGRPERAVPVPAARGRCRAPASRSPSRAGGRWSPRCRRWSSPSHADLPAAHDAAGSTPAGSRWCWPCCSGGPSVQVGDADVYAATVGGVRLTEPAADLAVALAVAGAAQQRPAAPPAWSRSARSAWPARSAGSPGTARRLAEAARLGFTHALVPPDPGKVPAGIEAIEVRDLGHALRVAFPGAEVIPFASRRH